MTHIDDQGHVVVDVTRADGTHEDIVLPMFGSCGCPKGDPHQCIDDDEYEALNP